MKKISSGYILAIVFSGLTLLFLLLPVLVVIPVSFTAERFLSLPTGEWSLRHYVTLIENPVWRSSAFQSLVVATATTLLALVVAVPYSIACWRMKNVWSGILIGLGVLPLVVPSIMNAVSFFRTWSALGMLDTYHGVIIAHAITAVPYVIIGCAVSLANFDPRLEMASRSLGAGAWRTTFSVIIPQIIPGISSGAIFAFIMSWDELIILLFISSREIYLLPRAIWSGIRENIDPSIAAISTLLVLLTLVVLAASILMPKTEKQ